MQYQTCDCGEQISPNELGIKLLTHWQHQHQTCLYSYIGCVSILVFESTVYVYMQTVKEWSPLRIPEMLQAE